MKSFSFLAVVLLLAMALFAAGCGSAATRAAPRAEATPTQPRTVERSLQGEQPVKGTETPMPTTSGLGGGPPEVTPPAQARAVVRLAIENLAGRLGLKPDQIRLISVEAVDWSDTSLGCPQPGMMYAQVITPGFRVILEAGGKTYEYHTNQDNYVVLCQPVGGEVPGKPETPTAGLSGQVPPEAQDAVRLAIQNLAGRLNVAADAIQVVSVEAVEWSDASLGCPQPGMMYAQVITPGYRVVLEAGGQRYEYHTDTGRFVVLCEKGKPSGAAPSKGLDTTVQDGWPNQTRDEDVAIRSPMERM